MADTLPKNNGPKLKWWQKWWCIGALVGLVLAVVVLFCFLRVEPLGPGPASAFGMVFIMELPVLPIFILLIFLLSPLYYLLGSGWIIIGFPLAHFISWILGGIVYAYIFRVFVSIFKRPTKRSQKNKR